MAMVMAPTEPSTSPTIAQASGPPIVRSTLGLAGTVIMVCCLVLLGLVSATSAASNSLGRRSPEAFASLWPDNGYLLARIAGGKLGAATTGDGVAKDIASQISFDPDASAWARRAILAEPSANIATRMLALAYQTEGDRARAAKLMELSQRLSRRDSVTNLWLVEDALLRADVPASILQIDIVLRTDTRASQLLLPQLAALLPQEDAAAFYAVILKSNPPWMHDFWSAVLQDGSAPRHAGELRKLLHEVELELAAGHDALLIDQLIGAGAFAQAFELYNLASDGTAEQFTPIDWRIVSDVSHGATLGEENGRIAVSALRGAKGPVAQRLVRLSGGEHRLLVRTNAPPGTLVARLTCAHLGGASSFEQVFLIDQSETKNFRNSSECQFAWLTMALAGEGARNDLDFGIDQVVLTAANTAD